ncbi:MAG: radical SAM family heme chaperone HemW [Prevotella sp.]|nr:radical SAM family heme chaperone HemW [Prevotella sp.]
MAGLYIHIPFCRSRCIYCGFYSTTALGMRQRYVDALCKELQRRAILSDAMKMPSTIYLGGGTPSQLSIAQLRQLFHNINKVYGSTLPYSEKNEITMEVNPDDVTDAFCEGLKTLPVNRISMGAQTFSDERLHFLRRRHSAGQVALAVERLRKAGISNISIDLMYGFPGETLSDWQNDISQALALQVEHLSAYCLIYEEGTPLCLQMKSNPALAPLDEELERQMYYLLKDRLEANGFEHYEISNFARPGFRSRHNSSYWNDVPYIGLGASAHSYDGNCRSWNVSDLLRYIEGVEQGEPRFDYERLSNPDTRYNDLLTVSLRTREGLDLDKLTPQQHSHCLSSAQPYLDDNLLTISNQHLHLTRDGLFVSDMIISDLMLV